VNGGFKVFDSDMHVMEPPDLWERYIASEFKSMAPRGVTSANVRDLRLQLPGLPVQHGGPQRRNGGHNFEKNQQLYADHARRGWLPEVQLEAMNAEGIDVAVLFPSRGLSALTPTGMEPNLVKSIQRACWARGWSRFTTSGTRSRKRTGSSRT
jgi:hypothetical protein